MVGVLKTQRWRNLSPLHGNQNFDQPNQSSRFQRVANVGLHAAKQQTIIWGSLVAKGRAAGRKTFKRLQLGRITQLSAGRVCLHVVNIKCVKTRICIGSLQRQDLAFHTRCPEAATFTI